MNDAALAHRFMHHPPSRHQAHRHGRIRAAALTFAQAVVDLTPGGTPEQGKALDAIDVAMMQANAAIAREQTSDAQAITREQSSEAKTNAFARLGGS